MTTTTDAPALGTIGQIAINTKDASRAVRFYRDTLGLQLLFEAPPQLAFFKCGEVTLMLSPPETAEFDHASSVLYFNTPDITRSSAHLRALGVTFRDEPHLIHRAGDKELWMTFFEDSEGNILALQQWRTAAA
jgi:catechol 2,3-dioxygenase-like lactoylglutathione lyase family enzyme